MTVYTLHLLFIYYSNNLQISFKSKKDYLCAVHVSKNSVQQFFGEEDFQRFCIKLSMFKLFLAIILLIM